MRRLLESVMRETKRAKRLMAIEKKSKPSVFAKHAQAQKNQPDRWPIAIHRLRNKIYKAEKSPTRGKTKVTSTSGVSKATNNRLDLGVSFHFDFKTRYKRYAFLGCVCQRIDLSYLFIEFSHSHRFPSPYLRNGLTQKLCKHSSPILSVSCSSPNPPPIRFG